MIEEMEVVVLKKEYLLVEGKFSRLNSLQLPPLMDRIEESKRESLFSSVFLQWENSRLRF